jgi:FkbM family methyltransferase
LLDLVICVDTAVAHLAGAMGKTVWLLLSKPADWRWLEIREDTPWYPTMRLFRQSHRGQWEDVVARVQAALQVYANHAEPASSDASRDSRFDVSGTPGFIRQAAATARPDVPAGMSAVAETQLGILQFLPDEAVVGDSIRWYGEYLQRQLDTLARMIRPGATVMEVAAGVGMHALFLARAVGVGGQLFLYEARPSLQRVLRQNLAANLLDNVTVMHGNLGAKPARVVDVVSSSAMTSGIATPQATLTETLDELQLEALDLLKLNDGIDALDVLAGATESLWRLRPQLHLAAPDSLALTRLERHIKDFGYRCWRMETPLFRPGNFYGRDTDIFSGKVALSLLANPEEAAFDMAPEGCVEL